ncbi:MAG: hypothetical protein ABGW95_01025, partial [Candidatus Poseidoniia archaeon]
EKKLAACPEPSSLFASLPPFFMRVPAILAANPSSFLLAFRAPSFFPGSGNPGLFRDPLLYAFRDIVVDDGVGRLLAKLGVGYPSATDPQGELPALYELPTMPTSFVIDGAGVIRLVHTGFRDGDLDTLRPQIKALLAAPAKAVAR